MPRRRPRRNKVPLLVRAALTLFIDASGGARDLVQTTRASPRPTHGEALALLQTALALPRTTLVQQRQQARLRRQTSATRAETPLEGHQADYRVHDVHTGVLADQGKVVSHDHDAVLFNRLQPRRRPEPSTPPQEPATATEAMCLRP